MASKDARRVIDQFDVGDNAINVALPSCSKKGCLAHPLMQKASDFIVSSRNHQRTGNMEEARSDMEKAGEIVAFLLQKRGWKRGCLFPDEVHEVFAVEFCEPDDIDLDKWR